VLKKQNIRHFFETPLRVDRFFSDSTVHSSQSNLGFLAYLSPTLIISSEIQRGGEPKTQNTNQCKELQLAGRETNVQRGNIKNRSQDTWRGANRY